LARGPCAGVGRQGCGPEERPGADAGFDSGAEDCGYKRVRGEPKSRPMTISTEWMTMRDVSTAIRGGELSCREAVEALLERIERFDGRINAYLDTTAEAALARADAMDRGARGE